MRGLFILFFMLVSVVALSMSQSDAPTTTPKCLRLFRECKEASVCCSGVCRFGRKEKDVMRCRLFPA